MENRYGTDAKGVLGDKILNRKENSLFNAGFVQRFKEEINEKIQ